jgi:transposase
MQYAQVQVLPPAPPGGVTAGIDWATAGHVACVVDEAGKVRSRLSAVHDRDGIRKLVRGLRAAGAAEVAIERGEGILVDALPAAGLTVVVITSRQVKNLRSRYGSAGAKDDRFDAFVLARLRPLVPDSPATLALRAAVRARRDLAGHRIAACNQLRARLAVSFPAGTGLFSELDSPISLAFLSRSCTQDAADLLSEDDLAAWLKTLPNRGRTSGPGQLRAARPAPPAPPAPAVLPGASSPAPWPPP